MPNCASRPQSVVASALCGVPSTSTQPPPVRANATARLTATVVVPTPPLPAATTISRAPAWPSVRRLAASWSTSWRRMLAWSFMTRGARFQTCRLTAHFGCGLGKTLDGEGSKLGAGAKGSTLDGGGPEAGAGANGLADGAPAARPLPVLTPACPRAEPYTSAGVTP